LIADKFYIFDYKYLIVMDPLVQTFVIASVAVIITLFVITCSVNKISEERSGKKDFTGMQKPKKIKRIV